MQFVLFREKKRYNIDKRNVIPIVLLLQTALTLWGSFFIIILRGSLARFDKFPGYKPDCSYEDCHIRSFCAFNL